SGVSKSGDLRPNGRNTARWPTRRTSRKNTMTGQSGRKSSAITWALSDYDDDDDDHRWTRISKSKPAGPPRDPPPERDSGWSPPSRSAVWRHKHRGFMTSLAARSPGRPKKANKLTRAEIQKRYRDRQRARNPK